MVPKRQSIRRIKTQVLALLNQPDFDGCIEQICRFPLRQVVNPLFSFLYHMDPQVRWRAVSAMGAAVSAMAVEQMESARIIMRRFIWNLNDESGGIGWGSPEAMGEIMAQSRPLAEEYSAILVSYIDPAGNFLEHPDLQPGALWGIGRLAHARPQQAAAAACLLVPFLNSETSQVRGLAVWASGALPLEATGAHLRQLAGDTATFRLYRSGVFSTLSIGELVQKIGCGANR